MATVSLLANSGPLYKEMIENNAQLQQYFRSKERQVQAGVLDHKSVRCMASKAPDVRGRRGFDKAMTFVSTAMNYLTGLSSGHDNLDGKEIAKTFQSVMQAVTMFVTPNGNEELRTAVTEFGILELSLGLVTSLR